MQNGCIARTIQSNETSLFPLFFQFTVSSVRGWSWMAKNGQTVETIKSCYLINHTKILYRT